MQVSAAGRTETVDIEVVSAERPQKIVERNVGLGGRRIGNGTYTLEELPREAPGSTSSTPGSRRR